MYKQTSIYICAYIYLSSGRFEVVIIAPALVLQLKFSAAITFCLCTVMYALRFADTKEWSDGVSESGSELVEDKLC